MHIYEAIIEYVIQANKVSLQVKYLSEDQSPRPYAEPIKINLNTSIILSD